MNTFSRVQDHFGTLTRGYVHLVTRSRRSTACGNRVAVAEYRQGEKVMDLGRGDRHAAVSRRFVETGFTCGVEVTREVNCILLKLCQETSGCASV